MKRSPRRIAWHGQRRTWSEWAVALGLDPERGAACFRKRARLKWTTERILTTPVRRWSSILSDDEREPRSRASSDAYRLIPASEILASQKKRAVTDPVRR